MNAAGIVSGQAKGAGCPIRSLSDRLVLPPSAPPDRNMYEV